MIKNFVFDLGGVLVDFIPKRYLDHIGLSSEEAEFYSKIIWGKEWMDYNANKYSFEELKQLLLNNNPEIREKLDEIITNIDYHYILSEKTNTANYLKELKQQGYNIYVLSDLSKESLVYNKEFDFFEFVDGGVYSFEVGSNKPNENNYKTLLNTYNLIPGETIFIDDNINNINAANNLGIIGIQFTSLDKVKEEITNLIS